MFLNDYIFDLFNYLRVLILINVEKSIFALFLKLISLLLLLHLSVLIFRSFLKCTFKLNIKIFSKLCNTVFK